MSCIYKYKGKDYTKDEFYSLVRTTMVQPRTVQKYEKVLFPKGDTAAKIEGHQTLEEFKKQKEDRIKELEDEKENVAYLLDDSKEVQDAYAILANFPEDKTALQTINNAESNKKESIDLEIKHLEQELADVESGQTQLSSIANFYENTITNILKKNGYNPVEITDEYGNKWNEIKINSELSSQDIYLSPRNSQSSSRNERPVTDNYIEYINYKKQQLEKVKQILKVLNRDKRNPKKDTANILEQIKKYHLIEADIKQDIETLQKNEIDLMFHAISEEIQGLSESLDNVGSISSSHNVQDIKSRINFLYSFIKGVDLEGNETGIESLGGFNHPDFADITTAIDELYKKYLQTMSDIRDKIISEDISFASNIEGNNNISEAELAKMFNAENDINWLEKTFLGITNSSNNDTILPQILKSFLETKVALREAEVKRFQDRLNSAIKKLTGSDFEFIFEKTKRGTKTGNIINLTSPLWRKAISSFMKLNKDENLESRYKKKANWLKTNAEVIDIRKLKVVQELYGVEYEQYFKFSSEEMDDYEKHLQDILGPLYDDEINSVLNALLIFQEQKATYLEDTGNAYKNRNVARVDPWAFIDNYFSPTFLHSINYEAGTNSVESVFSDIQNIRFIPRKDVFVTFDEEGNEVYQDSGYYNSEFDEIKNDVDKLEYWKVLREIYQDYVNPTYSDQGISDMSYAKFEETFIETLSSASKLQKGTKLFKKGLHEFKALFYERGMNKDARQNDDFVISNYYDSANKDYRNLIQVLQFKNLQELKNLAAKENVNITNLHEKADIVKEIALKLSLEGKSTDINKVTGALLDMTAIQKAKEDTLPIANIILDSHKMSKDSNGNERKNSISRMENWIDRIIKNKHEKYRGGASFIGNDITKRTWFGNMLDKVGEIPFINKYINKKKMYLLSDNEKELLKHLTELKETGASRDASSSFNYAGNTYYIKKEGSVVKYLKKGETGAAISMTGEEYDDIFEKYIASKISELGLDLSVAGFIQGLLKVIIIKGLGLNPVSGIFNRIEGKNSAIIMDKTGKYWTKGNIHKANNFMAFANFIKILPERMKPDQLKKVQELEKFQIFLNNVNLIQDRKNELERQAEKSDSTKRYLERFNLYQMAVDNPEFKNQGAILLSILMDTKVKDLDGNETPIFDGKEFKIYNNVDGRLVLKPEYRTEENITNWENFDIDEIDLKNNQFFITRNKMKNAISRSQGNYDNLDIIDATKNIWGRSLTLFMKWMPEHFMQRFSSGKGIDLTTGESKLKGRYRYLWDNHPALFTTGMATLFMSFGMTPLSIFAGAGFTGFVAWKYFRDMSKKEDIQREVSNTQEFIAFTKSIIIETLNYPLEALNIPKAIKNDSYKKTSLTQEEANNLVAIAKELGIKLTMIAMLLLVKKMTWDDDDDKDSKRRQFHNFMDNQLNRNITTLSNWTNPNAFLSDVQRLAFLRYLSDVGNLLTELAKFDDGEAITEYALKSSPLPRLITKGSMPWYDKKEYDNTQWEDRLIKDMNSDGEWSAKQEYLSIRQDKREEIKERLVKEGYEGQALKDAINKEMNKALPKKKKDESYKSILEKTKKAVK